VSALHYFLAPTALVRRYHRTIFPRYAHTNGAIFKMPRTLKNNLV